MSWTNCACLFHPIDDATRAMFYADPSYVPLDMGNAYARKDCPRCKGAGYLGEQRELLNIELAVESKPNVAIIYGIKKTHFDSEGFPEVVVQPEPHACVYCKQPVQSGHCGCV